MLPTGNEDQDVSAKDPTKIAGLGVQKTTPANQMPPADVRPGPIAQTKAQTEPENALARAMAVADRVSISLAQQAHQLISSINARPNPPLPSSARRPPNLADIKSAKDIGPMIRAARKRMKFNQQSFADAAGVGRRFVSELESGKPTLEFDKVMRVCAIAGVELFAAERRNQ